jgi:uncharacterized protein (DUF952 family)
VTVFHIARAADWHAAQEAGEYRVSTLGRSLDEVGFIHASFAEQVPLVAAAVFGEVTEPLVLLAIDEGKLKAQVIVEHVPAAAQAFPHIYGPIPIDAVKEVRDFHRG